MLTDLPVRPLNAWPLPARVAFRWLACYFALYCLLPTPFSPVAPISRLLGRALDVPLPWLGRALFGIGEVPHGFPTGSGDTIADYLRVLLIAMLAIVGAAAWTAFRDAPSHRRLAVWLLSGIRYSLALALMGYGAIKILMQQMPEPDAVRLTTPFGELSPMGLLWAFTGASRTYEIFGGLAEFIPGVLLVFRRTTLIGAMLAVPVMVNVVLLNFAYDVPVKLYSLHLLVMSLAVIAPNMHRLYGVLVQNCAVAPGDIAAPVSDTRLRLVRGVWKGYVLAFTAMLFVRSSESRAEGTNFTSQRDRSLEGAWTIRDAEGLPNSEGWTHLAVSRRGYGRLRMRNDSVASIGVRVWHGRGELNFPTPPVAIQVNRSPMIRALTFALPREAPVEGRWSYPGDTIVLHGQLDGNAVHAVLVRRDLSQMELTNRGFHWVQQYPNNR